MANILKLFLRLNQVSRIDAQYFPSSEKQRGMPNLQNEPGSMVKNRSTISGNGTRIPRQYQRHQVSTGTNGAS